MSEFEAAKKDFTEKHLKQCLFKGEEILFNQINSSNFTRISPIPFLFSFWYVFVTSSTIALFILLPPRWFLFAVPLCAPVFMLLFLCIKKLWESRYCENWLLVLTNYRILALNCGVSCTIVSFPYSNMEMRDWKDDGLQFWFIPTKSQNGVRSHITVLSLSIDEKLKVKELFLQGQSRNLDDFEASSVFSPNLSCDDSITHLLKDQLPLLWYHKLSRYSSRNLWVNVFLWGFCITLFLVGVGPGVMLVLGMNALLIGLLSAFFIVCWLFAVFFVYFNTQLHYAITEKGLFKIETGFRGPRVESQPFSKVFPMYTVSSSFSQSSSHSPKPPKPRIFTLSFQSPNGLTIDGPLEEMITKEEILFRKYLDTLKEVTSVV